MLYSYIVKKKIRQTFDDVNNHRWDEAVAAVAPQVHHRVSGIHALAGERNDKEALRCWFQRLGRVQPNLHLRINNIWVNGWPGNTTVFVQWDGTATLLNGDAYVNRGLHVFTLRWGRAIIAAFYGKSPGPSYFVGCSDGGREALMEAQRFPEDFRGIVAGAPANYWTHLFLKFLWDERSVSQPGAFIPPPKLKILQAASLTACDSLDGLKDGLIENPQLCHFNPSVVQCKGEDAADCLTTPQVQAAQEIYGPAVNSETSAEIAPGFSPGAEANPANWALWITGMQPGAPALDAFFANNFLADMVFANPKLNFDSVNLGSDVKLIDDKVGSTLNSDSPNLSAFKSRGGKLIHYAGWGDAAIPPQGSVNYFESVQSKMGNTKGFYRLFMVPGMSHCGGGAGANAFGNGAAVPNADASDDVVIALDRWVEHGVAPAKITATRYVDNNPAKGVEMTRPLCPYPQQARYNGSGDPNQASSFTCRVPPALAKH